MSEKHNDIEIRSEEVQEILGKIPNWIIRCGITLIFAIVVVLIVGSCLFKYPEIISSPIMVTTENPPIALVAKVNGKLQQLFVKDNQWVQCSENIAILENPSDYRNVFELKCKLDSFRKTIAIIHHTPVLTDILKNLHANVSHEFSETYIFGELQTHYGEFLKSYADFLHFLQTDYQIKKINSINEQINEYKVLSNRQIGQQNLLAEELNIDKQQYQRDSALFAKGATAKADIEKSKSLLLQKKINVEGAKTNLSNTLIQIMQLQQTIINIEQQYDEQSKQLKIAFTQSFDNLQNQINIWEQNYMLKSPIEGKVSFTKYWAINQNIMSGDKVVTIVPDKASRTIGKLDLPIKGSGKVQIGQSVNIKLENYPYMEYGMLLGKIETISLVTTDNHYSVEVSLPGGLVSNYGKRLEFSIEMKGTAEIITENMRLIEHFLNPLKALITKNQKNNHQDIIHQKN